MTVEVVTVACLAASMWSLLCRVNMMEIGRTRVPVILGSALLLMALFLALILPASIAKAALAVGVLAYLITGASRWREGPPPETLREDAPPNAPEDVPPTAMRQVAGAARGHHLE